MRNSPRIGHTNKCDCGMDRHRIPAWVFVITVMIFFIPQGNFFNSQVIAQGRLCSVELVYYLNLR